MMMTHAKKPVVLSGVQPTNQFHVGNYVGALRQWVEMSATHECYFMIVDMHAITVQQDPKVLRRSTLAALAQLIACGLDPEKAHLFVQSQVTGHTELGWILGSLCSLGQLERMTQFKDKSAQQATRGFIGSGLLFYPVLQSADILLYNADQVPVGEDQKQHLELTRDLAQRFNHLYGETFKVPEAYTPPHAAKIMSLQEPLKKMSKSDANALGTLFLLDAPAVLKKKIMSAVTDAGHEILARQDKPGVTNLLNILSAVTGETVPQLEARFAGQGYGQFKGEVAAAVIAMTEGIQRRYSELMSDPGELMNILKKSAAHAQSRATAMLSVVYERIGFLK